MEPKNIPEKVPDLTQPAALGSGGTGPSRVRRPIYQNLMPPCNYACPAGENIQAWLALAQKGDSRGAWLELIRNNPLPAIHGRVCYHPCESACNRAELDGSVAIHGIERFLGDLAIAENWIPPVDAPPSGKRVLVIGSGPSGLSCAFHLCRLGHEVEIYEAAEQPGGMMRYGIPSYRLPREVLDAEIGHIEQMGVSIRTFTKVIDLAADMKAGNFQAAFIAIGAHLSKRIEIPSRDAARVYDAVSFLKSIEQGKTPQLGRRVTVYGGGNTAMDAARVAKRLGHEPMVVYRRDYAHMPAHPFEADEARDEGITFHWLRTLQSVDSEAIQVEIMELDAEGKARGTGKFETLESDDLILALGQESDTSFLKNVPGILRKDDGSVVVDYRMMTGAPGIFAGGDMVPSDRTVTVGTGHGKRAARHIDSWLRGDFPLAQPAKPLASFDKLRLWFYTGIEQAQQNRVEIERRRASFEEVVKGYTAGEALHEAGRCLSCGNCFECDGCFGSCPENAIERLGPGKGYRIDFGRCTGCGICFEQCPCHAISLVPEPGTRPVPR